MTYQPLIYNNSYRSQAPIASRFAIGGFAISFALGFLTAPLLFPGGYQNYNPGYNYPNYYNQNNYYPKYY